MLKSIVEIKEFQSTKFFWHAYSYGGIPREERGVGMWLIPQYLRCWKETSVDLCIREVLNSPNFLGVIYKLYNTIIIFLKFYDEHHVRWGSWSF